MVIAYVALTLFWLFVWFFFASRLTGYRLLSFLKDTVPFALASIAVMIATGQITNQIESLWLLLLSRVVIAAALYYIIMRIAGARILAECIQFILLKTK